MATFHITEDDGTDWGTWTADSELEAMEQLGHELEFNPDAYCGKPTGKLIFTEV